MASRSVRRAVEEAAVEEDDAEMEVHPIEKIQMSGINAGDISKLKSAGVATVRDVLTSVSKRLLSIPGISEAKLDKIRDACNKIDSTAGAFMTAGEKLSVRNKTIVKISTGSSELDRILGGGIETQSLTEFFGESRTGKTQTMLTMCVTAQLPKQIGGGEGKVIYIDTEGKFRPSRLESVAERFEVDKEGVLNNVMYIRAFTHEHQMSIVDTIGALIMEDGDSYSLICSEYLVKESTVFRVELTRGVPVDSLTALFRSEHHGRGELNERQIKLNKHLQALKNIAETYNVAIVFSNQVCADPGAMSMVAVGPKAIGGNILAHASTWRVQFKKGRDNARIAKLYNSPSAALEDATFALTEGGVADCD